MTAQHTARPATLQMTAAMILSGSIGVLVVESGQAAPTVVFWRCLFGALALGAYVALLGRDWASAMTVRALALMALSGVTMAANWVLFFMAYRHAPISTVTIVYHVYPFVLILAAAVLFREPLHRRSLAWAAVAFLGVVLVVQGRRDVAGMNLAGLGLTAAAMIFYAGTLLIAKKLDDVPPELTALVQLVVGALILWPLLRLPDAGYSAATWGCLLTLGVVHTGLLYVLLYSAIQNLQTSSVALLSFLYPATALGFDILIYDVRPSAVQIGGAAAILLAVLGERMGWGMPRNFRATAKR